MRNSRHLAVSILVLPLVYLSILIIPAYVNI